MERKQKENKRIHNSTLRYVWVRVFSQTDKCHFHVLLLINKDAYYHLGDYDLTNNCQYQLNSGSSATWVEEN